MQAFAKGAVAVSWCKHTPMCMGNPGDRVLDLTVVLHLQAVPYSGLAKQLSSGFLSAAGGSDPVNEPPCILWAQEEFWQEGDGLGGVRRAVKERSLPWGLHEDLK